MMDDPTSRQQEEVALREVEERAVEIAPHKEPTTPGEWVRENLFSTWRNGLLTVVTVLVVGYLGFGLLHWIFVTSAWDVVKQNLSSYMLSRFPREEVWRVGAALFLVVGLSGLSYGCSPRRIMWTRRRIATAAVLGVVSVLILAYLLESVGIWLWLAALTATFFGAVVVGRVLGRRARRPVLVAWLLLYPVLLLILIGFGGPSPRLWGGMLLNVMVGSVVIVASFPIGVLLALGRRSSFPAIRTFCVGVIELIRGVPLFTLLLAGVFVLPLLFPPGWGLPVIVRIAIMFTIFSSVYVAEIVRGGLQGIHHGQYEAGRALGLPTWRMTAFVILPQALRNTIPAMISHFISVWKDTSLLALVAGLTDLLESARRASAGLEFIGRDREALIGAAFLFWLVAFTASRWSQRLERRVGVGER